MQRNYTKISLISLLLLGVVFYFINDFAVGGKEYSINLEELRTRFNQDKGKVRLLLLLSPS